MNLIRILLNWLKADARRQYQPNDPDLNPIDTDAIKREIRLEEEAELLGKNGIPTPSSTSFSGIETKVIQVVDEARQKYVSWAHERLRILNQDIITHDITPLANRALDTVTRFEHRADAFLSDQKATLQSLSERAIALQGECKRFKEENSLFRQAHYPTSVRKFLLKVGVAVLICGEGGLNASFFAQGIEGGLINGFIYAVALSVLNVGVAAMFGSFVIPNMNHRNAFLKILGFVGLFVALSTSMIMALLIAHIRDALNMDMENAGAVALATLTKHPFELAEISSWVLFGLSIFFSILGVIDGYKQDDPYPGYGKISRRMIEAEDYYDAEMSEVRRELEDLKEEIIKELEDDAEQIKTKLACLSEAILNKEATGGRLNLAFSNANTCASTLVKTFQDINRIHRPANISAPNYFGKDPVLQELDIPSFDVSANEEKYGQQLQLREKVISEKQNLIANIQASFNNRHDALQALDTHFPANA